MKTTFLYALSSILLLQACQKSEFTQPTPVESHISKSSLDSMLLQCLFSRDKIEWTDFSDSVIFSALQYGDSIMSIGYAPPGKKITGDDICKVNIHSPEWEQAKNKVLALILKNEYNDAEVALNALDWFSDGTLPFINIKIKNFETVKALRSSTWVRYAEPLCYEPKNHIEIQRIESSSGCGSNTPATGLLAGTDYLLISPNCRASWNYPYHSIFSTWTRCSGAGIKIFMIDTGVSPDQENIGYQFNQGYSTGRTIERMVTLPQETYYGIPIGPVETYADGCGHGTAMSGVCAAPRGIDGNTVGIAYNSNFVICRAAADVYLDESREVKGVTDAFINAANRSDVRIISMSLGKLSSSSQMADAVRYAYGKGKLIFCAGGTSLDWTAGWTGVIFPASMSEVNAVTGVKNDMMTRCDNCHDGSQIDFTAVMQKSSGKASTPLSLAMDGDAPSTIGGSSVATATIAGIAALVWSRFPGYSRDQILHKLIVGSGYYPYKSSTQGWGVIDAYKASN